jgi:hypothetical protein
MPPVLRALSDPRSLLKNGCSHQPAGRGAKHALRIGVLLYPFNAATAGQELLHGLCLLSFAIRWLSNRHYGGSA